MIKDLGKQILNLEHQISRKEIIAYTLNELALSEDYQGDKIKANQMYEEALNYSTKNSLSRPKIDVSFIYAQYCARYKKDNYKAIEILEAIENDVLRSANLYHKQYLYSELKSYYYFIENYKKAFEASNQYFNYYQELDFNESFLKLNEIERKFDVAEKQKELKDKEVKIKIQNLEITNSKKRFWLICSFFGFTILGSLALFLFFKREKKTIKN
jgi:tetratricopeptide (TPR) repeat protein